MTRLPKEAGNIRPQTHLYGQQCIDFDAAQLTRMRQRVHFCDRGSEGRGDVWIRVRVEANVAVTDLHEAQSAGGGSSERRPRARRVLNWHVFEDAVMVQTAPVPTRGYLGKTLSAQDLADQFLVEPGIGREHVAAVA